MSARVTHHDVYAATRRLIKAGCAVSVNKQTGGWRMTDEEGKRDISPRLPAREFVLWLDGYLEGFLARPIFREV